MRENQSKIATREECATALHELSDDDLARLETIARIRAIGLRVLDWHDLLHDAIERLLDRKESGHRNFHWWFFSARRCEASNTWKS